MVTDDRHEMSASFPRVLRWRLMIDVDIWNMFDDTMG